MNNQSTIRKYLSIDDIQKEYLPISKKRLRMLVKKHLDTKTIGNRLFVEREQLEALLNSDISSITLTESEAENSKV